MVLSSNGSIAFVADRNGGIQILDISNLTSPRIIGSFDTNYAVGIAVSDNDSVAFVADWDSVKIVDVSNATDPRLISSMDIPEGVHGVHLLSNGRFLLVATGKELKVLDVSNLESPEVVGSLSAASGSPWKVITSSDDRIAFVTTYNDVEIVDISNPENPKLVDTITNGQGWFFFARGIAASSDGRSVFITNRNLVTIDLDLFR